MLTVPATTVTREAHHDHVRPKATDQAHHVAQHLVFAPDLQRLLDALRVAEVDRPREQLLRPVTMARLEQLLRPDQPQTRTQLGPNQILPAVTARDRQVRRPRQSPLSEVAEQRRILVVGMSGHVQHAREHRKLLDRQRQLRPAGVGGCDDRVEGGEEEAGQEEGYESPLRLHCHGIQVSVSILTVQRRVRFGPSWRCGHAPINRRFAR